MKTKVSLPQLANFPVNPRMVAFLKLAPIWIIFVLGLVLVVLQKFGLYWDMVPGDLGDGRFNNYILEHFFLWVKGAVPASSYWDAPFFYPYQGVTAFSDNLLGSAPIYALFRWFGLNRETAFQGWYLCSFVLNYVATAYVLLRAKLKPLAVGIGAFFFTFGIPMLSQGEHLQLYYRFGVPLACFFLLEFFKQPKWTRLVAVVFWVVWQFYLSIYLGIFLVMMLTAMVLLAPCFETGFSVQARIYQWPIKLKQTWFQANWMERIFSLFLIGTAVLCLFVLLWPYYKASGDYGFLRSWKDISVMLPVPQSFLLADNSVFWKSISAFFGNNRMVRNEHQLFPGITTTVLLVMGLLMRFKAKNSQTAWLYLWVIILLVIATLNIEGFSIYWLIWNFPGMNSIRAVTRIQLVWMWPLAFFIAQTVDEIMQLAQRKTRWLYVGMFLLTVLMIAESTFFLRSYYLKADGISRIARLERKLPKDLPQNPILVVAYSKNETYYVTEIDAMLAAQALGWPTLNGYSGNTPPHYIFSRKCADIQDEVKQYTVFAQMEEKKGAALSAAIMKRIVPVGFQDCDPDFQQKNP